MEKKQNLRSNQPAVKLLSSESRKSNSDTKQLVRNSRRRENNNTVYSTNANQFGKASGRQVHQTFEPKSRNYGSSSNEKLYRHNDGHARNLVTTTSGARLTHHYHGRHDDEVFDEPELNSIYLPGSKKQNLTHLLNFKYAPREHHDSASYSGSSCLSSAQIRTKRTKYNKEQFLQANCQFVVRAGGDYAAHAKSPDLLVDWTNIEQIHIFGISEEPQCPICLYHPVAAKMTRCGHVYCWPCILHYLALSDKKSWRKCPICYEAVHLGDLKSVVALPHRNYNCGEIAIFQLMCRGKESLAVHRVENRKTVLVDGTQQFPSFNDHSADTMNSKLLLAKYADIISIIERERNELKCQLTSDGEDCIDSVFVHQALVLLHEREEAIKANVAVEFTLNVDADEFIPTGTPICNEDTESVVEAMENLKIGGHFYFYQSTDGQNLYLHSINSRMLQMMYGSLERAPRTISGQILQKESSSMNEDMRRRYKYLQHLPITSQFEIVEIKFEESTVSREVLEKFDEELQQRQKARQRRALEERKRERYINRVNEQQMGMFIQSAAHIDFSSEWQFPSYGPPEDPPLATVEMSESPMAVAGPSFANVLTSERSKKIQAELWPALSEPQKSLLFAAENAQPVIQSTSYSVLSQHSDDEHDNGINNDDLCPPPEFSNSFGLAIAEALNKSALDKVIKKTDQTNVARGKKKKNKSKTILFSNGGRQFDNN